jgi:S-adenosylmethionine-dependent methyltransferase
MPGNDELRQLLIRNIFQDDRAQCATPKGIQDLEWQLWRRTDKFRSLYGRWLSDTLGRAPQRILEIGCGTGSSTLALTERGHHVDVTDIDPGSIDVALLRCAQAGHAIGESFAGSLEDYAKIHDVAAYDAIVLWASLEHMTIAERLGNLRLAHDRMRAGSRLLVLECPNRLWLNDAHTSQKPFYHWLPDELIIAAGLMAGAHDQLSLYRLGRGASYHEFQAAGIPVGRDSIIDSLQDWGRRRNLLKRLKWLVVREAFYERGLMRLAPEIHPAFFHEHLDLCLTKASG